MKIKVGDKIKMKENRWDYYFDPNKTYTIGWTTPNWFGVIEKGEDNSVCNGDRFRFDKSDIPFKLAFTTWKEKYEAPK